MSRAEMLTEIERLRSEMSGLAAAGVEYARVLEVSQELDKLIVMYHRTAV